MKDKVFGDLSYDGGWCKNENIFLWGKENIIKIVVSAYEDEIPNSKQQNSYIFLKNNIIGISDVSLLKVKEYMDAIKEDIIEYANVDSIPDDIFDLVSINEILFLDNGSFGIMCNTKWDTHGMAVLINGNSIEVGPQDIVW